MMMGNNIAPRVTQDVDGWDGYGAERRELLEYLLSRRVRDVVVLTGDEHEFYAGVVTPSGRLGEPAAATEFVGGSITSGADPDPPRGRPPPWRAWDSPPSIRTGPIRTRWKTGTGSSRRGGMS